MEHVITKGERVSLAAELRKLTRKGREIATVTDQGDSWLVVTTAGPAIEVRS